ncbi:hypothetical protein BDP55DRAFT_669224, partial [Colletotrichum godetiae]
MSDALSVVASLLGFASFLKTAMNCVTGYERTVEIRRYLEALERTRNSIMLMSQFLTDSGVDHATNIVHGFTSRIGSQISDVYPEVERVTRAAMEKGSFTEGNFDLKIAAERLMKLADDFDSTTPLLRNLEHTLRLRRIEARLDAVFELSGQTAAGSKAAWDTIQLIEKRIKVGANEEEELAKAIERWDEMNPDSSIQERAKSIEAIRDVLKITLGSLQAFKNDPMSLPFVIPVPAAEDVQARVKLDTGSRWNWISSEVLRKAGISFEAREDLGELTGAGRDPLTFKPLGRVSVTWLSTNQALSKTDDFLVHDPSYIPCDVILGETWIFNDLARHQISEPVLQIRQLITKEQILEVETQAKRDGASNAQVIKLHSEVDKVKREEKRRMKLATRAAYRALTPMSGVSPLTSTTPLGVTRRASMTSVSRSLLSDHARLTPETTRSTENVFSLTEDVRNTSSRVSGL